MLTLFRRVAKKSKTAIILYHIYDNRSTRRRFNSGKIELSSGSTHANLNLSESLSYISQVFDDYLKYSGVHMNMLKDKKILEIGHGDNFGVALKFLLAGAKHVACLDKFFSNQDWKHQRKIYQMLREPLGDDERQIFDEAVNLDEGIVSDSPKLLCIYGTGIEEAETIFEPESFDLIISRAVLEHLHKPDTAFSVMDRLLVPGGSMIHKIDFRDHGIFSGWHHPLTFLTLPESVYKLMTHDSGKPNRRLTDFYRRKTTESGYDTKLLITRIVGSESEIVPHKETVTFGVDYTESTLSLLKQIRPHLKAEFRKLSDEELMVSGLFLIARKPEGAEKTRQV